jgi:hypothetical protein
MPRHDAMESEPAWFQLSKRDAQLLHRAPVKKVDAIATVDKHVGELACVRIGAHDGIQEQSVFSRAGHQSRMVLAPPGDGSLRPVHELGFCRHDSVHLRLIPKVTPFVFAWGSKDMILLNIH